MRDTSVKGGRCALAAAAGLLIVASSASGQVAFRPFGFKISVAAVSADGTTVIGDGPGDGDVAGFRWRRDSFITLGDLPGGPARSYARALSADGNVIYGFASTATSIRVFRWQDGVMAAVPGIGDDRVDEFDGIAVSADGGVLAGQWFADGANRAYRMESTGTPVSLDHSGRASIATDISADGRAISGTIGNEDGNGQRAFRWEDGVLTRLPTPAGATSGEGNTISADGTTVVGSVSDGISRLEAFLWRDGVGAGLGDLPGGRFHSRAFGASADGRVIVGIGTDESFEDGVACVWEPGYGPRSIKTLLSEQFGVDLTGWILLNAVDVSADGRTIVGNGIDPRGNSRGWIAVIPSPAGALPMLMAAFVGRRPRRKE